MFHQVQTWRAIRAMCTDSSLKEGHVYNHASNYLAVDYQLIVYGNIANQIHARLRVNLCQHNWMVPSNSAFSPFPGM